MIRASRAEGLGPCCDSSILCDLRAGVLQTHQDDEHPKWIQMAQIQRRDLENLHESLAECSADSLWFSTLSAALAYAFDSSQARTCIHACMHTYIHTCNIHLHIHIHIHIPIPIPIHIRIHKHIDMHIHIHMHIRLQIHMHIHIHVHIHIHIHIHTYIYIYIHHKSDWYQTRVFRQAALRCDRWQEKGRLCCMCCGSMQGPCSQLGRS